MTLLIDVLTLFPEMIDFPLQLSILGKARKAGKVNIRVHDIRNFTTDRHNSADDIPYGGGEGMVLKPEPLSRAIESVKTEASFICSMSPQGDCFNQNMARQLVQKEHLIILCGHYEGIDERILERYVSQEISIGDYITSGGEIPALVVIDTICRLIPGILGNRASVLNETYTRPFFDHPVYTRPQTFEGMDVPDVLLSGHHLDIKRWRLRKSLEKTVKKRPDLLDHAELTDEEQALLQEIVKNRQ